MVGQQPNRMDRGKPGSKTTTPIKEEPKPDPGQMSTPGMEKKDFMKKDQRHDRSQRGGPGGGPRGGDRGGDRRGGRGGGNMDRQNFRGRDNNRQQGGGNRDSGMSNAPFDMSDNRGEGNAGPGGVAMLPPQQEKKFTGRCRLFVGNLPSDTSEEDFKVLFEGFGELSEVYLNTSRGFGFVRLDTRANAEAAKAALDGTQKKGRFLRVRFATHGAALKVKYIPAHVSNELLEQAFTQFGQVERAIVIVDDRGRSTGEGIVEFARKPGAQAAMNRINEGIFLLTSAPRPIIVEPLDQRDDEDGLPERFISKAGEFAKEREQAPRFGVPGSFEFEFAQKWKDLYHMEKQQQENVKTQMEIAARKLEDEMDSAQHEHQAMLLRQDLMRRQEELRRMEEQHQHEMQRRMELRRADEQMRVKQEEQGLLRQQQEEIRRREMEEQRRRQEDNFFQERTMRDMRGGDRGGNIPALAPPPAPPTGLGIDRSRQGGGNMGHQGNMGNGSMNQGGHPGSGGMGGMGQSQGGGNMGGNHMQQSHGMISDGFTNSATKALTKRQSRFDQPPQQGGGNMGGGFGGNMGGSPGMGNNMMGNPGNMAGEMGNMGRDRGAMMERNRERGVGNREDYSAYEAKRARRF